METIPQPHESEDKGLGSAGEELKPNSSLLAEIGHWARQGKEERFATQVRNMTNNVDRARQEREENNQD